MLCNRDDWCQEQTGALDYRAPWLHRPALCITGSLQPSLQKTRPARRAWLFDGHIEVDYKTVTVSHSKRNHLATVDFYTVYSDRSVGPSNTGAFFGVSFIVDGGEAAASGHWESSQARGDDRAVNYTVCLIEEGKYL